jgi:hypothetical protein
MTDDNDFEERKNTGRVIVAIPTATEPVHHLGDVTEPKHMTMVWLGKPEDNPNLDMDQVRGQVEAVAEQFGPLTGLVESTGQLGDDNATVWFLRGEGINEARDDLLNQSYIRDGFGAVEQFPQWTPHVTAGYDLEEPIDEETSPDEIIFDRLAVWDGDEHTEYPLGPSASTEENTEPVNGGDEEMIDELLVAMTRPLGDPLVVNDAGTLAAACAQTDALDDETTKMTTRRVLARRARVLGLQHVIPRDWARAMAPSATAAPNVTEITPQNGSDVVDLFQLKTQLSTLPDTALRAAYMRDVREYTMTAPQSRPPLPRDVIAQARVNSLIRLAQGDLSARTDDRDLLR